MIADYLRAGYPALAVITHEPQRAELILRQGCDHWRFHAWDCMRGTRDLADNAVVNDTTDPLEAVRALDSARDTVLIAHNLHLFMDSPEVTQAIVNGSQRWKALGSCLVLIAPALHLRPELEKVFTILDMPLPDPEALLAMQAELGQSVDIAADPHAAAAAKGLTEAEAEAAFALSLIRRGSFSARFIADLKAQALRKTGLLEYWEPADINQVGGLDNLKAFIRNRVPSLQGAPGLPRLKSILLVGIPGCGKSLTCKAVASMLDWPLVRLDIGNLKGSLVGESERRMREATKVIDAFGQAVVWCDEIEKAFAGTRSSGMTDGGASAGMLSHWLTWMQETTSPVLVIATANTVSALPPEFLRAGRWDALFFVDLPTRSERAEILTIMNAKYSAKIPLAYAEMLDGFSGSEIEQVVKDSLFDGIDEAVKSLVPLSRTMHEEVSALRNWARSRARLANAPEPSEPTTTRKVLSIN